MLVHIIDDDESVLRTLSRSVKQGGWEPILHCSADEFLVAIDDHPCGCVLSDINMPGRSGVELIEVMQKKCPEWPVVMMTGFADVSAAVRVFRHGAVHFLQKPFKRADLLAALLEAAQIGQKRRLPDSAKLQVVRGGFRQAL